MSDTPQGDGWWQASDGKFYPPEQQPATPPPAAPTPAPDPASMPTQVQPAVAPETPTTDPSAVPPMDPSAVGDDPAADDESSGKGKRNAIIAVILLVIAALIGAFIFLGGDDDDSDDNAQVVEDTNSEETVSDIGDATTTLTDDGPIDFDKEYRDKLEATRTEARYTLDAPPGAIMTLTVTNDDDSTSGVFAVFEASGSRFIDMRVQPGASESETVTLSRDGADEFDLVFTEGPASYTFKITLDEQNDAGDGDAGEDFDTATAIDNGQAVNGVLAGQDTTDHYTLDVEPGTELTLAAEVARDSERAAFFVVQLEGSRLLSERVQPGADTKLSLLMSAEDEGTLEVIVTEGPANYTFTTSFTGSSEGGEDGDAPSELSDARTIDPTEVLDGTVGDRDSGDYFVFTAAAASFSVEVTADAESDRAVAVTIEDDSGSRAGFQRVQPGSSSSEVIEVAAGSTVRLIVTEGRANYSITIT